MNTKEKLAKILLFIFIAVFSFTVLAHKIPETQIMQNTMEHLEHNQNVVMAFSGASLGISLGISALPDDFASPQASTISDLNTYFIIMFAIICCQFFLPQIAGPVAFVYFTVSTIQTHDILILTITRLVVLLLGTWIFHKVEHMIIGAVSGKKH